MKQNDLEILRQRKQQLEADRTANKEKFMSMDKDDPGYNELIQKDKTYETQLATNQMELTAAEKKKANQEIEKAGKVLRKEGLEGGKNATQADATKTFIEDQKGQGRYSQIYHNTLPDQSNAVTKSEVNTVKINNNLPGVKEAQQKAEEQPNKDVSNREEQENNNEPDR